MLIIGTQTAWPLRPSLIHVRVDCIGYGPMESPCSDLLEFPSLLYVSSLLFSYISSLSGLGCTESCDLISCFTVLVQERVQYDVDGNWLQRHHGCLLRLCITGSGADSLYSTPQCSYR